MKTFARLIRRYVLATAAVVLVAAALCLGAVAYMGHTTAMWSRTAPALKRWPVR